MPEPQTIPKPHDTKQPEETEQPFDALDHLKPIPKHPLAAIAGRFRDSAFFADVVENMRVREEEESKKYAEDE